jgi:uncharacterized protein DUF6399/IclR-like helix-turn-helix domain-containing protein
MGFWDKSLSIVKCLRDHGKQSVRRLAQKTGFSKSSVHRLQQAMTRRGGHPESWWWETAAGRQWVTRLVVATLYTFGLKRGVGLDTMQTFFVRLHLATQVGCSPSALRRVMQTLEATLLETAATWEKHEVATGGEREIIGAVDETFLEQMVLVFMDLPTGYIILEETADERSYATWHALVDTRLTALKAQVRYLVSDRAKALIQLAEKGLECLSMPDFFHLVHDIVKSYSLALGRQLQQARQEVSKAEEKLQKHPKADTQGKGYREAMHQVEAKQAEVTRWEAIQHEYRQQLATLSLTLHPFCIDDSAPQTSTQVAARLHAQVEAIEALARTSQLPERPEAMTKVKKQLPAVAALVDFWWQGVRRDVEHAAISPLWQRWAQEVLLPQKYWERQVTRTRCTRRKAKMQRVLERVRTAFHSHVLTRCLPPQALKDWHVWATHQVDAFQRASSAVEGRNGYLAGMHHQQRGLPKRRYKVWTVLHNFDMRAADGTTPAARFFRRSFPDLFETVLANVGALPQPRQRKRIVMLSP